MANKVLLKKSSVTTKVPLTTDLDYGELALNYADGKLYFKNSSNVIKSFTIDDNVVTLAGTQTLTNKTLTSPTINGAALSGTLSGAVTLSGITTFSGGDGNNSSVKLAGYNQRGGAGYHGFLEATNTFGTATNPNKYFRINSTGALEIVNSAYTSTILALTDAGALTVPAISIGGNLGTNGQVLASTGTGLQWLSVGGTGTVTSVALSLPSIFSVSGSPVTTTGTLTAALASQTANTVFAAPNGTAGAPTFRALVAADIPALSYAPTAGSTSVTTLGTVTTGTWNAGIIGATYGGTGVNNGSNTITLAGSVTHAGAFSRTFTATGTTSVTLPTTGTLATLAGTETLTNKTISLPTIDNIKLGYTTTATAAGTTVLTAASNRQQLFTGTTTQTITLPVTSTLTTGTGFEIENNSTGNLTVNSSGGNLVATVPPGVTCHVMCIGTTLTTAADWDADFDAFATLTGTGANVLATSPTLTSPSFSTIVNTGTLTLPTSTDTLVGRATTDTLTNKTIAAGSNTISGLTNANLSGAAGITNANLANSTISGVALGGTLNTLTIGTGLSGTSYNGSSAVTIALANTAVTAGSYGSSTSVPVITVDAQGRITSASTAAISGSLTFTGDVTGTGSTGGSTALTLAASGVTAGTYTKITVDAKGRATSGTTLTSADLPTYTGTLTSSQITTGLGFTPYNSTNPSGYITSSASISGSSASAPLLSALGNYVWSASTLPTGYSQGIQTSFVQASQGFQSYGSVVNVNTYSGGGGALQLYVPYSPTYGGNALQVRFGNYDVSSGNSWTSWKTLLASDNYTSYTPSLSGAGASGTWGISITGNAATATTASNSTNLGGYAPNTTGGASTIVQRDTNGYIQNSYFYSSGGGSERNASGIGYFAGFNTSDYYIRSYTPAAAASAMGALTTSNYTSYSPSLTGSGASGTWGISVTGSSGSVSGLTLTSSANGINPDNVTQNQIGYNTSVSLFGQTDGGLYSSAYSSSWVHQIYGDFRTGQIAIRGKNNGTWQSWRTVVDSSNVSSYAVATGGGATVTSTTYFRSADNSSTSYTAAAIQLRESQGGGSGSYLAPRLAFHWGGVVASQIGIRSDGGIQILNNPGSGLENLWANTMYANAHQAISDIRIKNNVVDSKYGLNEVMRLRSVEYDRKTDGKHQVGLIAQEVEEIIPEFVDTSDTSGGSGAEDITNLKTVNYAQIVSVLIKAVQELKAEVNELRSRLGE